MMYDAPAQFALASKDGDAPAPALISVRAEGRLDAVMFELTLRQTYRNATSRVLEVVYTFPLPPAAVLLGFASELNGERQEGVIVAKREAEQRYEKSLEEGDAPVMLAAHRDGLHTANIGNLKPGDELVVECRFAQLLPFEQGRLRVSIPTTVAPRYGRPDQFGLEPQHVPSVSLEADYPLALTLTLGAALEGAAVECPTHRFTTRASQGGSLCMELPPGTRLDRDIVVIVAPREPRPSFLIRADDPLDMSAPVVVMAAMQPEAAPPRECIALKLLVDCSGSMSGDSITSARTALRSVVAGLTERDHVSLSRFGSTVEHLLAPAAATARVLRHLEPLINGIQADLGGTAMDDALHAVFNLARSDGLRSADVLLITDGQVWQAEAMLAAARKSHHRVFAIGVGSAPAEGVLRALAESTGGACEFVSPGEALEAAARRMLHRMRQPAFANVRIDWGGTPLWSCGPAPSVFGGVTVMAFAGFATPIEARDVRLLADGPEGETVELARGEMPVPCPGDRLPRIAAARRIAQLPEADARELAVQYQLISKQTHCILVHRRTDADKAVEQAELHRVSSMLPAGWGGLGSVRAAPLFCRRMPGESWLVVQYSIDTFTDFDLQPDAAFEMPAPPHKSGRKRTPASLAAIARGVIDHINQAGSIQNLAATCERLPLHADVRQAIEAATDLGLTPDEAWLALAHWVNSRANGLADASVKACLQPLIDTLDAGLVVRTTQRMERYLGRYPIDEWPLIRSQRLNLALRRIRAVGP